MLLHTKKVLWSWITFHFEINCDIKYQFISRHVKQCAAIFSIAKKSDCGILESLECVFSKTLLSSSYFLAAVTLIFSNPIAAKQHLKKCNLIDSVYCRKFRKWVYFKKNFLFRNRWHYQSSSTVRCLNCRKLIYAMPRGAISKLRHIFGRLESLFILEAIQSTLSQKKVVWLWSLSSSKLLLWFLVSNLIFKMYSFRSECSDAVYTVVTFWAWCGILLLNAVGILAICLIQCSYVTVKHAVRSNVQWPLHDFIHCSCCCWDWSSIFLLWSYLAVSFEFSRNLRFRKMAFQVYPYRVNNFDGINSFSEWKYESIQKIRY